MNFFGDDVPSVCVDKEKAVTSWSQAVAADPQKVGPASAALAQAKNDLAACIGEFYAPNDSGSKMKYLMIAAVLLVVLGGGYMMFHRKPVTVLRRRRK